MFHFDLKNRYKFIFDGKKSITAVCVVNRSVCYSIAVILIPHMLHLIEK